MKHSAMIATVLLLAACAPGVHRAGSIVITPFAADRCRTNDPSTVTPAVVSDISRAARRHMLAQVRTETGMNAVRDCATGDYELVGQVGRVGSDTGSRWWLFGLSDPRRFEVELEGELRRCGTGQVVRRLHASRRGGDLEEVVAEASREVIRGIKDMSR